MTILVDPVAGPRRLEQQLPMPIAHAEAGGLDPERPGRGGGTLLVRAGAADAAVAGATRSDRRRLDGPA